MQIELQIDIGTALHVACYYGRTDTVRTLLRLGAGLNSLNKGSPLPPSRPQFTLSLDGDTPLHLAAKHGRSETIRVLKVLGADFNIRNKQGKTPLEVAKKKVSREIVLLCNYDSPDPHNTPNYFWTSKYIVAT